MTRIVAEEVRDAIEIPSSAGVLIGKQVVLHPLDACAEFNAMRSMSPKSIVVVLKGIPGVDVVSARAYASLHSRRSAAHKDSSGSFSRRAAQ